MVSEHYSLTIKLKAFSPKDFQTHTVVIKRKQTEEKYVNSENILEFYQGTTLTILKKISKSKEKCKMACVYIISVDKLPERLSALNYRKYT